MIISHKHKFAFFRSPKTGSVTTNILLRMEGEFGPDDVLSKALRMGFDHQNLGPTYEAQVDTEWDLIHATATDAVALGLITLAQLEEYACFATIRDPYDRWLSTMAHTGVAPNTFEMETATNHYSKDLSSKLGDLKTLAKSQASYFSTGFVEPLDFRNLDAEIRRIVPLVGGRAPRKLPVLNAKRDRRVGADHFVWTPELKAKVGTMFPEDVALWNDFLTNNP